MPRISRIRVANIQYDNGTKQLPDIFIDVNGLDIVMLLANGGGKTLLIQLMMQTILPNEKMGGRAISNLLKSNKYTGHVAVEWLLDDTGEQRRYLCTGFCFTNGSNDEQGIRYFNYCFDYQGSSKLNIKNLPLTVADERGVKYPTSFIKLRDFFKFETNNRVETFDTNYRYQNRLREYQILPEEWKNIRDTNGSEGGVDKFFEKSKTTQQLMDNLLIPSVEDMVFQSEQKKKELVHAFNEYRSMLIQIPVIKKNIKDFNAIRQHAEGLVTEVEKLDNVQKEHSKKTRELVSLAKTFTEFKEKSEKRAKELEDSKNDKNKELSKLKWQRDSYRVFEKQLEYNKALQEQAKINDLCEEQERKYTSALENANKINALVSFNKITDSQKEIKKHQTELEIMEKAQPELQQQLKEKKNQLFGAWSNKQSILKDQLQEQNERVTDLNNNNKQLDGKLKERRVEQKHVQKKLDRVQFWFEQYQLQQKKLLQDITKAEVLEPKAALKKHEGKLIEIEGREEKSITAIKKLEEITENLSEDIIQMQLSKGETEKAAQAVSDKIGKYEQQEENLQGLLAENKVSPLSRH